MLRRLPEMFSSRSRTAVLLLLEELTTPICLKEISQLTGVSVCAIQATLLQLRDEGWVYRTRKGKETLYRLNREHPEAWLLKFVAGKVRTESIRKRVAAYAAKAQRALAFASDTRSFLSSMRRLNDNS